MFKQLGIFSALAIGLVSATMPTDIDPYNLPYQANKPGGHTGFNRCIEKYGKANETSLCQNAVINDIKDFCLWGPPKPNSAIGDVEGEVVSYCTRSGYGTRLIPKGTFKSIFFTKTPSYVQVNGKADLTKINVKKDDEGGELDPHGATQNGNPIGGLVFTTAFSPNKDTYKQVKEWNSFISADEYCFRACVGDKDADWCPHIYDVMGCAWNNPGDYVSEGVFESCDGENGEFPGVYNGVRWHQDVKPTPPAHKPGKRFNCHREKKYKYASYHGKTGKKGPTRKAKHPIGRRGLEEREVPQAMQTMVARQAFEDMDA